MEVPEESDSLANLPSATSVPSGEQVFVLVPSLSENTKTSITSPSLKHEDNEANTDSLRSYAGGLGADFFRMSHSPDFESESVSSVDREHLDMGSEYASDDGDSEVTTALPGSKRPRGENLKISNSSKKRATDKTPLKTSSKARTATKLKKSAKKGSNKTKLAQKSRELLMRERKEQLQGTAADSLTNGKTVIETAAGTHTHEVSILTHALKSRSLKNIVDGLPSEQRENGIADQNIMLEATRAFGKGAVAPDVETGRWRLRNFTSTLTHYQVLGSQPESWVIIFRLLTIFQL
jgi:hypothetical protein